MRVTIFFPRRERLELGRISFVLTIENAGSIRQEWSGMSIMTSDDEWQYILFTPDIRKYLVTSQSVRKELKRHKRAQKFSSRKRDEYLKNVDTHSHNG